MILKPRLASHAPNERRIKAVAGIYMLDLLVIDGKYITSLNIIPSRHRRDSRKCELLNRKDRSVNENASKGMINNGVI